MRTVDVATLTQNIKEMCIEANHFLSEDMKTAFTKAEQQEKETASSSGSEADEREDDKENTADDRPLSYYL